MRIALVAPVDPTLAGNGAALRAGFWRRTLAGLGDLATIVIPIISEMPHTNRLDGFGEIFGIEPFELSHDRYPALARFAPEWLGARWAPDLAEFDLIVGFRSYVAPFCLGLAAMYDTPVAIDLDDDDAAFHRALGDTDEADRYDALVADIRNRCRVVMSTTGFRRTVWVPNVAALPTGERRASQAGDHRSAHVVMVANLGYAPNAEGARWFVEQVWPMVRSQRPDARLTIAGPGGERFEHGVGFVDDLTELYASADVAIAPILHGSGTRIKILDAWARRVPVVATDMAIGGLGAVDREHALIEDRPGHFADAVVQLLGDPGLGDHITEQAADLLDRVFAEQPIAERAKALLRRVVDLPVGPVRIAGVRVTETADGVVIDDPTAGLVHHLDAVSAIVFALCDGCSPLLELSDTLADILSLSPEQGLRRCSIALDQLAAAGLVIDDPSYEHVTLGVNNRHFRLRPGTSDREIAFGVYGCYDYDVPDRLPPGTIGIDVGAHIGSFTGLMIDSGAGFVVAVEPQSENFTLAMSHLAYDIEGGVVDLRRAALWAPPAGRPIVIGTAPTAHDGGVNSGGHESRTSVSRTPVVADGEVVVASETLDDIVESIRRDVSVDGPIWLKLDCEGAEWSILETAHCLDQIDVIVGELHLDLGGSSDRLDAVVELLESWGFDVLVRGLTDGGSQPILRAQRTPLAR